jgi:hypothetical protein
MEIFYLKLHRTRLQRAAASIMEIWRNIDVGNDNEYQYMGATNTPIKVWGGFICVVDKIKKFIAWKLKLNAEIWHHFERIPLPNDNIATNRMIRKAYLYTK